MAISTSSTSSNSSSSSSSKSWNTSNISKRTKKQLKAAESPFSSKYTDMLDQTLNGINNRKEFQYDVNKDALYQQYAKQYKALGQNAMKDTMANAASLTGGFGNSYAVTAGQQAYNNYMDQLNNVVPDLYAQARSNYDAETQDMYNKANLYAGLESEDYAKWADERSYWSNKENNEWNRNAVSHSTQKDKQTSQSNSSSYTPDTAGSGGKGSEDDAYTATRSYTAATKYLAGLDFDEEDWKDMLTDERWKNYKQMPWDGTGKDGISKEGQTVKLAKQFDTYDDYLAYYIDTVLQKAGV